LTEYKYGLKPVLAQPQIMLSSYYTSDLPSVGSLKFPLGHADLIQPHMFMNDTLGDCAIAGSIEEVRLANALRGVTVPFTDETAVQNYSAITGYSPDDPESDQGTDVHVLMDYRKATGIVDADGKYHKIVDYAGLTPGDWDEMLVALSLFPSGIGIGVQVTDYVQDQNAAGQPWHLVPGHHSIEGGHYIPIVGATDRHTAQLYTWGGIGGITEPYYNAYNTVAVVALTEEMFKGGKDIDGVDFDKLAADLNLFNAGPVMAKAPKKAKAAYDSGEGPYDYPLSAGD
jgi:hypothetical protein